MTDKVTLASVASFQNDSTAVAQYNANNAAITTAMDNTLSRDGTSPNQMGSVLDMNSNQVINLPAPASLNSPIRLTDLNTSIAGGTIHAIPAGGVTGTVLLKNSNTDYDVNWSSQPGDMLAGTNITMSGTNPVTVATTTTPTFTSVQTPTIINTGTLTLPTSTDTLVGRATTDTLTNKTIPSFVGGSAAGSNVTITSTASGAPSGDFILLAADNLNFNSLAAGQQTTINLGSPGAQSAVVGFSGSGSGNTNVKASAGASGTLTLPAATDTLVGKATTDTLTNKTLTTPVINGTISGTTVIPIANGGTNDTGTAWTTYTPTVTAGTGSFTSVSATGRFKTLGKTVFIEIAVTDTTNGTAATLVQATLPVTPVLGSAYAISGFQGTGFLVSGNISTASGGVCNIFKYDGTFPLATGQSLWVSGIYESV